MLTEGDRPWPGPGYKAIFRSIYVALIAWSLTKPVWWTSYVLAVVEFVIWMFLEWVWLRNYRHWLEDRTAREFTEKAQAGLISTDCPKCGEQNIPLVDFVDQHLRLFHPDLDLEGMMPSVHLQVHKPPLWVRLW